MMTAGDEAPSGRVTDGAPSAGRAAVGAISYDEALVRIAALEVRIDSERVALDQAAGLVLAKNVLAGSDQPPFDRSTMDGYALRPDPARRSWRVLGAIHAGETGVIPEADACWRIMTGAPVPAGCAVVPIEATDRGTVTMTVSEPITQVRNVALQGEDARVGARVLAAGSRLTPLALAACAMAGADAVKVRAKPRITVLTSGDEVGAAGPAGIRDSNGPFLAGWLGSLGLAARRQMLADQPDAVRAGLAQALEASDLVITTGGVSMGDRDLIPGALVELGCTILVHGVDIQPGKPVLLAQRGKTLIAALPGNPVSVVATAHLFLLPMLVRWGVAAEMPWLELPLTAPASAKARRLFLPGQFTPGGVAPVAWNGSGDLYAAAHGHGLLDLAPGCRLGPGDRVRFLPYVGGVPGVGSELPR